MMEAILNASSQVMLNGDGYGRIRMGPAGESWLITRTMVRATSHVKEAVTTIYQTNIGAPYQLDITYTGSTGDTTDTQFLLTDGDCLWVEWVGGDPGAVATVTVSGTRSNPIGGFRAI